MKIEVADAAALPGWLQNHVSEGHLDLAAIPEPEDVTGLKSALQKERGNNAAWSKFGTPDEVESRIADLEKQARGTGKDAEEAQAKMDAIKADYDGKLSAKDAKIDKLMRGNATATMKAELSKAGFIPEAVDMAAAQAMSRVQFDDEGGAKVMTADGKPMIGNGPDHGATLADLAQEFATSMPFAVRDGGKGGGGKQPGSNGGTPSKKWGEMTSGEKVRLHRENPEEYERVKAAG